MKALVYEGPERLAIREVATPQASPTSALIKIAYSGICGSDMHAFLGHDERRPAPLILGHEAAGFVVEGPLQGKSVTINPLISCGSCRACKTGRDNLCGTRQIISMPPREGAFAEYVSMPPSNLVVVPEGFDLAKAALTEPLACGWHGVRLALQTLGTPDQPIRALVLGGGAIGVGSALSMAAVGIEDISVVEPNGLRRERLTAQPGFKTVERAAPAGDFDLVIDAVGYEATRAEASAQARPGGVIAHIGLGQAMGGLDVRRMTLQEITFIGTYTYTMQDFHDTAEAIFAGRFGDFSWVEQRPLDQGAQAFADIRAGKTSAAKIVLVP